jgi:hypothetical protein
MSLVLVALDVQKQVKNELMVISWLGELVEDPLLVQVTTLL